MSVRDVIREAALPPEYSSFVGRRTLLASARGALGSTRLLTLLGPGGVGKTRFAIRLAQSVGRLYPDGTWFVDVSGVGAAGSVADEVGTVLGLQAVPADDFGPLARFFGGKQGLLVLDSCEQVVDQCAQLVARILRECRQMKVVATSRVALRLSVERVLLVEPLETSESGQGGVSPAVTLFLERCATVLADPAPDDVRAIAEICRRVDGLPLAIELAATRVRALTPAQILDRLAEPLDFLTGGDRDVPDRQRTMRATIGWSYELCTEPERAAWRLMSGFVGGWDLESAEWMSARAAPGESVIDLVQSLVEKSIVTRRQSGGSVYFVMLDTVRMFGLEQSSAEDLSVARALHRDWFLHRLATVEADWYGPHQARWLALTRRELPNIRAALEFCINNGDAARAATLLMTAWRVVWQAHGRTDELGRWCARVVELESSGTPDICQAMTMLGGLEVARGDEDIGRRRLGLAGELAEQLGDDFSRAFVCAMRGSVAVDAEQSLALMEESLALQGGTNLIPARANVEERIAALHDRLGHADSAAPLREALIARAIGAGDSFETEYLLHNTGWSAATRGDVSSATMLLRQSLSLMQNLENPVGVAQVEELLASVAADSQDYARAALLIGIADTIGGAAGAVASAFPLDAWLRGDTMDRARRMLGSRAYDVAFANGKSMSFDVGVAYALGAQLPSRPGTKVRAGTRDLLTARESQVAALVGQGLTDREIADRLVISKRTAEGHVANSLTKLGFTSRTQLASWTARDPSTDPSQ